MCMYMYIDIFQKASSRLFISVHAYIYVLSVHVCVHVRLFICVHVYTYMHIHICTLCSPFHACLCMYACMHVCKHAYSGPAPVYTSKGFFTVSKTPLLLCTQSDSDLMKIDTGLC
jgi:hypothetical protein